VANLSLYAVALVVFTVVNGKTYANIENQAFLGWIFSISLYCICLDFIGCCFVGIFDLMMKEP
ncbi:hypothetical protein RYX36_033437, partial [Vicia faba]